MTLINLLFDPYNYIYIQMPFPLETSLSSSPFDRPLQLIYY